MSSKLYISDGWKDNIVMLNLGQSGGVAEPDFEDFINGMKQWAFSPSTIEELYITFHIDHDYKPDSAVFPHIHWTPSSNATGVVRWGIDISRAKGHSQEAFNTNTTIYIEQEAGGVDRMHHVAEYATGIFGGGDLEPDTVLICKVFRDATHPNDTYPDDAFGIACDLHYESDRNATPQKTPDFNIPVE
jgi:hypothetical protein